MNILIFSAEPHTDATDVFRPDVNEVNQLHGFHQKMLQAVLLHQPDLLVVSGFALDDKLIQTLSQVMSRRPRLFLVLQLNSATQAQVIECMRLGARDVIADLSATCMTPVLQRATQVFAPVSPTKTNVIGVISVQDGDGDACIAANLAYALARLAQDDVLTMDLRMPFGDLDMFLTQDGGIKDILDIAAETERMDRSLLKSLVHPVTDHLDLIASPATFEKVLRTQSESIYKLIGIAAEHYPHLVLNMGATLDRLCMSALGKVTELFVVTNPSLNAIRRLNQILNLLKSLEIDDSRISVLVNGLAKSSSVNRQELEATINKPIRDAIALPTHFQHESLLKGKPILQLQPSCPFAQQMNGIASQILGIQTQPTSLWQRLRKK